MTDAILAELENAGLVEQYVNEDGQAAMRLTPKGVQLGRSMAMADDDADADAVLPSLLGDAGT